MMPERLQKKEDKKNELVPLTVIDDRDETFRMSFCPELGALKTSLGKIGLINPIILRRQGEHFQIVSGYRRVLAAQSLGWKEIKALLYASDELSHNEGFLMSFYENLGTRSFNIIEASLVVAGFSAHCGHDEKQIREEVLPLLGFNSGRKIFLALRSFKQLSYAWKELIIKNDISLLNAAKICSFSPLDQNALYDALSRLKLGENKFRESLDMTEEICKRDDISLSDFFTSEYFKFLGQQEDLNLTEKTERFRKTLKTIRYPEFTRLQENFYEHKKKLALPPQITLAPPDSFEGNTLKVMLEFHSPEELRPLVEKLHATMENKSLRDICEML